MSSNALSCAVRTAAAALLVCLGQLCPGISEAHAAPVVARDLALPRLEGGGVAAELQPTSLASADLDGDGVADLVVGLARDGVGAVAVYLGNVDAIYPYSPQARARREQGAFSDAPFAVTPLVASLPIAPDFVITGDLDNDGHWDVAAAALGSTQLEWLRGDGTGRLTPAQGIRLPGRVTAMTSGEVNRSDGIEDVVVAVAHDDGAQLLVFESPLGALRGAPEVHQLPAPATDLALGFAGSWTPGVAAVAGADLVVVHGRDRRLSLDAARRTAVPPARINTFRLPIAGVALTSTWPDQAEWQDLVVVLADGRVATVAGNALEEPAEGDPIQVFTGPERLVGDRARVVAARCTTMPGDDLFVIDPEAGDVSLLELSTADMTVRRSRLASGGFVPAALVMRLAPPALRSLLVPRRDIPHALAELVTPTRSTFVVNDNDDDPDHTLDGVCETAPGNGVCTLRAALQEANATPGPHSISFAGMVAGDHTLYPLGALPMIEEPMTIDGTTHPDGMVELDGTAAGVVDGLLITAGSSALRGFSVHSFHGDGVRLTGVSADENVVEGCHVGTDLEGVADYGNAGSGIAVGGPQSSHNRIGGATPAARNVISGNQEYGVWVGGGWRNKVRGNYVGTDATGTVGMGNDYSGIGSATQFLGSVIGGSAPGQGNLVSGNGGAGVSVSGGDATQIFGNLIGTDVTGTLDLGNSYSGVSLFGTTSTAMGSAAVLGRNVISGNAGEGIKLGAGSPLPGASNLIQNNLIGTDLTGTQALGNSAEGVEVDDWISDNVIGGSVDGAGNVISGNGGDGIAIGSSRGNVVLGNLIGTDVTATLPLANTGAGVSISGSSSSAIGGTGDGDGNTIAFNTGDGVSITGGGLFNSVLRTSIAYNGGLAIDLDDDGVTPNDPGDADSGTNRLINFPEITSARINAAGEVEVTYTVDCDPLNADYDLRVELFAADTDAPDASIRFLGFDIWTTGDHAAGTATTVVGDAAALGLSGGEWIVATTTDEDGNTSEFGAPAWLDDAIFRDGFESGDASAWSSVAP